MRWGLLEWQMKPPLNTGLPWMHKLIKRFEDRSEWRSLSIGIEAEKWINDKSPYHFVFPR